MGGYRIKGKGQPFHGIGPLGKMNGFKITNGYGIGGGANVTGDGTILRDNIFYGNQQEGGYYDAAIAGNNSSPIIDRNILAHLLNT